MTLLTILPVSLSAEDSAAAVLRSVSGTVLVNQGAAPASVAVFRGDVIETRPDSSARMDYQGSTVEIDPESIIRLEDGEIILDHGSVTVTTFQQLRVHAGCVLAAPVNAQKTIYFVKDTDSRVIVNAREKDVNLDSHSGSLKPASQESSGHAVVHQGEQKSREEHCGAGDLHTPPPDATIGPLNSYWAVGTGAAIIIAGTLCILLCFNNAPPSPASPSNSSITANHP